MLKIYIDGNLRPYLLVDRLSEVVYPLLEHFQFENIQSDYASGRVSLAAVSAKTVRLELTTLASSLTASQRELVIPLNSISTYYHHELTISHFNI